MSLSTPTPTVLEIKGSLLPVMIVQLFDTDKERIAAALQEKVQKAPNFFLNATVILDLNAIQTPDLPLSDIVQIARDNGLTPVGIRGANDEHKQLAAQLSLGLFPNGKEIQKNKSPEKEATPQPSNTKIVSQPVRSGQQVVCLDGDLVILSSVSHGAEVLAKRHIHVYGALRGRALAGVNGDTQARIFCHHMDAEIVSIAGNYQVNEDLTEEVRGKAAQVFLENDKLMVHALNTTNMLKR
ncbi:septum site-determining protein MinC [Candidatus Albibeggiatoa sp. nov. NOAA]|uniref:septum site-determining protein MinC n=1 Tax=Candidatus Albibeggiatoa sp. nov. NOAA TaxID=3162724 RepID=UPI0032FAF71A|nr:septum site-determining protein MinC [Thiotrichaceae bacterium]